MQFVPIKTRVMKLPRDNMFKILDQYLPRLRERDIVVVTSKVVSIHEGRVVAKHKVKSKDELILREAEQYLPRTAVPGKLALLTIKNHTLIASSGIDSKNAIGYYILWPKDPMRSARKIWQHLKQKHKLKELGIIITDSHSIPLRHGTLGIAIGFHGLHPLIDYTGTAGITGRLKFARANLVDSIAATATTLMGESNERTPAVVVRNLGLARFTNRNQSRELFPDPADDIYAPLLEVFRKKQLTKQTKTSKS